MNRKFIAVLCAISSVMSLTVAVHAKSTDIINDNFDNGNGINNYSTNYQGTVSAQDNLLLHQAGNDWNDDNGIKKDITNELKVNNLKKGDTLNVSVDIYCGWYNGTATASLKIDGMDDIVLGQAIPEKDDTNDRTIILKGSVTVEQDVPVSYSNAYFVVTQPCGYVKYDNIKLTLTQDDTTVDPPQPSEEPTNPPIGEWTEVINTTGKDTEALNALINNGTISHYGEAGKNVVVDSYGYTGKPCIQVESHHKSLSGMQIDITDSVKNGSVVKATFNLKSNDGQIAEVSLLDSNKKQMYRNENTPSQTWTSFETAECTVEKTESGKVYLTIANKSGTFYVADLVISVKNAASSDEPVFSFEPAVFDGTLDGATLSDDGKTLTSGDEAVTAYKCSYSGKAENGLKVVVKDGDKQGEATTTTKITDVTDIVFYVVTNHAKVDSITVTPIE